MALVVIIVLRVLVSAAVISADASVVVAYAAPAAIAPRAKLLASQPWNPRAFDGRLRQPRHSWTWSTIGHTGYGILLPHAFELLAKGRKIESRILPLSDSDRGRFCFRFFCAFRSTYDYFSQPTAIRMGTFRFLGGYQLFGESVSSETSASALNACRNARESCRKPRKPQETFRKPPETASETVRFRGSSKRSKHFGPYPGINLYY